MIFVTVGTHGQDFTRLVKKADEIAGKLKEEVIIQKGVCKYETKNAVSFSYAPEREMADYYSKARVAVVHGGVGSIMSSLMNKKPTVVVPRLKKYNEHNDDHQLQITKELEKQGKITAVYDIDSLEEAVQMAKPSDMGNGGKRILEIIGEFLAGMR